jgi:hypothetical protein
MLVQLLGHCIVRNQAGLATSTKLLQLICQLVALAFARSGCALWLRLARFYFALQLFGRLFPFLLRTAVVVCVAFCFGLIRLPFLLRSLRVNIPRSSESSKEIREVTGKNAKDAKGEKNESKGLPSRD